MDNILFLFESGQITSFFIKAFGIVMGLLYLLFAVIMIKQVSSMKRSVNFNDSGIIFLLVYLQVAFASVIVFYALFIL